MKELTREELPTDSTHFVVTCEWFGEKRAMTGKFHNGDVFVHDRGFVLFASPKAYTNIRYWQFPEG